MKERIIKGIEEAKIVAIMRNVAIKDAVNTAKALNDGGIKFIEVTFNQNDLGSFRDTANIIRAIGENLQIEVGAGTVTSLEMLDMAEAAGAKFIISPNTNIEIIKKTVEYNLVSIPGALSPSEILAAYDAGADFVKLFPAGVMGTGYIKAIRGPINHIKLLAVGGVTVDNVQDFLKAGISGFGIGGNLVNNTLINKGQFDSITELAKSFIDAMNTQE